MGENKWINKVNRRQTEKKYLVTEDEIKKMQKLLRSTDNSFKEMFKRFREFDQEGFEGLQRFFNEIKNLVRNQGKSNMVSIDEIEKLIVRYGGNNAKKG